MTNAHVGADFERVAAKYFAAEGIILTQNYKVLVGFHTKKKHAFDPGSASPKILVECKSHKWTAGGKVPGAKMTTWNEAMYYFHLAPEGYRKIFFILRHGRSENGETLLRYYQRIYAHLIPADVEFIEWNELSGVAIPHPKMTVEEGTSEQLSTDFPLAALSVTTTHPASSTFAPAGGIVSA